MISPRIGKAIVECFGMGSVRLCGKILNRMASQVYSRVLNVFRVGAVLVIVTACWKFTNCCRLPSRLRQEHSDENAGLFSVQSPISSACFWKFANGLGRHLLEAWNFRRIIW